MVQQKGTSSRRNQRTHRLSGRKTILFHKIQRSSLQYTTQTCFRHTRSWNRHVPPQSIGIQPRFHIITEALVQPLLSKYQHTFHSNCQSDYRPTDRNHHRRTTIHSRRLCHTEKIQTKLVGAHENKTRDQTKKSRVGHET